MRPLAQDPAPACGGPQRSGVGACTLPAGRGPSGAPSARLRGARSVVARPAGWAALAMLGMASGCVIMDESGDKEDPGPPQADTVEWGSPDEPLDSGTEPTTVSVSWGEVAFELTVSDGADWRLGMAETGGSCGGDVACWTGEDCYAGFDTGDGSTLGPYCHEVAGGEASLVYGGDLTDLQAGTTVFRPDFADTVTFLLIPGDDTRSTEPCLVFGDAPAYYADLGCTVLSAAGTD